jgi:hypothetical protein
MNNLLTTQGEYRGDFTRDTFDPLKRFSRVLLQQGRAMLDADWNEQTSIMLHYLRTLTGDLIGEHGGTESAFAIGVDPKAMGLTPAEEKELKLGANDFLIGQGRYYVGGIPCENESVITFSTQPDSPDSKLPGVRAATSFLIYLDVWERHLNYLQEGRAGDPRIREVALGGVDTATRSRVMWQVRALESDITPANAKDYAKFLAKIDDFVRPGNGTLKARARKPGGDGDDCGCVTSPESQFRGVENQLYRVEIHTGGAGWNGTTDRKTGEAAGNVKNAATFKWSRENSSVDFAIRNLVTGDNETTITLISLGRDARHSLEKNDWVEIVDDDSLLPLTPGPLLKITNVDRDNSVVTLQGAPGGNTGQTTTRHPVLRRWNQKPGNPKNGGVTITKEGTALVQEGLDDDHWLTLENGVQIQFQTQKPVSRYMAGDYWLIPARVATGDVEWPGAQDNPTALPPHGVQHFYAPLSIVSVDAAGKVTIDKNADCRRLITPLAK